MDKYELTVSLKFAAQMTRSGKWSLARGAIQHVLDENAVQEPYATDLDQILVSLNADTLEPQGLEAVGEQIHEIADEVGGPAG